MHISTDRVSTRFMRIMRTHMRNRPFFYGHIRISDWLNSSYSWKVQSILNPYSFCNTLYMYGCVFRGGGKGEGGNTPLRAKYKRYIPMC